MRESEATPWYNAVQSRRCVLLASDDARLVETLTRGLKRHELEVVHQPSSGAAASAADVGVVLLDVPNGTAQAALSTLRQLRAASIASPAVALISPSDANRLNGHPELGICSIIIKPIDLAELVSELKRFASAAD